jgi:GNAT superfamily N-acetyltransferase
MPSDTNVTAGAFRARPLTLDTWPDLEQLFGLPGGSMVRGCWCMAYRETGQASWANETRNKQALHKLVSAGVVPGVVGYLGGTPAGWISLGPREDYLKLRRSPIMKPVDDTRVWSVVCSYVARPYRGHGVQRQLLAAAIEFACERGARVLEAYPVDKSGRGDDNAMWFGSRGLYEQAGFREAVRRSPTRIVMRLPLPDGR